MAATVSSSPWTKSWALDAEQHEDELTNPPLSAQPNNTSPPSSDFPSLAAATTTKPKKKNNKPQTLSLSQFSTYSASPKPKGLTPDELLQLPTAPRERTAEDNDRTRLGGGFRNYGGGDRDRSSRVSERKERVDLGPSRADEVDDWSKTKKFGSSFGPGPDRSGPERRERGGGGGFFNSNRADEVDSWGANRSNSFSSLEGPRRERRMGMGFESNGSGSDSDNWLKKKQERGVSGGDGGDNWGKKESSNGGGGARPKLNLQPRTLPVVRSEIVTEGKPKVGANPFGEARPREEVLKEKGKDWKEIDEKLEAVKLKEEKSEGFGGGGSGRRRGFGAALVDEKSVKTWRKPEANEGVASPTGSSADAAENNANTAESSAESAEGAEKVPEEN